MKINACIVCGLRREYKKKMINFKYIHEFEIVIIILDGKYRCGNDRTVCGCL